MCFSQFAQFEPRPTFEEVVPAATRPEGAPLTSAEQDPNLYGPIPMPPEWRVETTPEDGHPHDHEHEHDQVSNDGHAHTAEAAGTPAATVYAASSPGNGATTTSTIASVKTQTVEAVVVELANGTKLLICPL